MARRTKPDQEAVLDTATDDDQTVTLIDPFVAFISVADSCPYDTIQVAGRMWTRTPTAISRDDPAIVELIANHWITVQRVKLPDDE